MTAGKHKRGLTEELHNVDIEHAQLQQQYGQVPEAIIAPAQQLEAPHAYAQSYAHDYAHDYAHEYAHGYNSAPANIQTIIEKVCTRF